MIPEIFDIARQHRDNGRNIRVCFYKNVPHPYAPDTNYDMMVDCVEFSHRTKTDDPNPQHYGFLKCGIFAAHVRDAIRAASVGATKFNVELCSPATYEGD